MKNKNILTLLISSLISLSVFATIDYDDKITIVYSGTEELSIKTLPFIGCAGIGIYCNVTMFTYDYKIPSTGCGQKTVQNISVNALRCAKFDATFDQNELEVIAGKIDLTPCKKSLEYYSEEDGTVTANTIKKQFAPLVKKAFDKNFPKAKTLSITFEGVELN